MIKDKDYQDLLKLFDGGWEVTVTDSDDDDFLFDGDDVFGEEVFQGSSLGFLWVDDFEHLSQTLDLGFGIAKPLQEIG